MTTVETKNIGINVLSSNVFNLDQDIVKLPWRSLSNEKRIELFNKYFETDFNNPNSKKTIDTNTICIITELALKGKMKLKKEITYDKVNERIINIHALVPQQHSDIYIYKPEILIKKEKSKKIAKNVLFRKK
jgi:hypothetical protein